MSRVSEDRARVRRPSYPGLVACVSCALAACSSDLQGPVDKGSQPLAVPESNAVSPSVQDDGVPGQRTRAMNPFDGVKFHVDPSFADRVVATSAQYPALASQMAKVAAVPTAVWIDAIARVGRVAQTLDTAATEEISARLPVLSVFVLYDLPDRDCSARSSAGELAVDKGGEARYRTEFIDPIAAALAAHAKQRAVVLLEPDSLANLATNAALPRCAMADAVYRRSIAYAITRLAAPNVDIYLDAAHAGWLGWTPNRSKIAAIYKNSSPLPAGRG